MPEDERSVLVRLANEDSAAWADYLRRDGPRLWGMCLRVTRHEDDAAAELYQRICVKLPRIASGWLAARTSAPFRAYVATVVRREHIDTFRRAPREQTRRTGDDLPRDLAIEALSPEEQAYAGEVREQLLQSFGQLSEECRLLLRAFFRHKGKGAADVVARLLGATHKAVYRKRDRCIERLQELVPHSVQPATDGERNAVTEVLGEFLTADPAMARDSAPGGDDAP